METGLVRIAEIAAKLSQVNDIVRYDTKMRCSIVGYEVCFVKIDN